MEITTPNKLPHGMCPDMVYAELKASQKRKRRARMSALKRRAQAKAPLFADEIIARELTEKADHYNAEVTEKDIEIATLKVAARVNINNKDFDPSSLLYDSESDIVFSILAIEYRETCKRLLPSHIYYRALAKAQHYQYISTSGVYRADHWFNTLRYNGHESLAWSIHCAFGGSMPPDRKAIQKIPHQLGFDFNSP
ncbi:MAG: hypothetical protein K9L82_20050 [Chromatiaceae bacterium]|nr:hypothetical protein [Chromatiaceae bacterium]MCF7996066.1 hypothetical protein [Chromatiaceae bacterium]